MNRQAAMLVPERIAPLGMEVSAAAPELPDAALPIGARVERAELVSDLGPSAPAAVRSASCSKPPRHARPRSLRRRPHPLHLRWMTTARSARLRRFRERGRARRHAEIAARYRAKGEQDPGAAWRRLDPIVPSGEKRDTVGYPGRLVSHEELGIHVAALVRLRRDHPRVEGTSRSCPSRSATGSLCACSRLPASKCCRRSSRMLTVKTRLCARIAVAGEFGPLPQLL